MLVIYHQVPVYEIVYLYVIFFNHEIFTMLQMIVMYE